MSKRIVVNFGRFNPPSVGHRKLARAMADKAGALGATASIWISQSYDGAGRKDKKFVPEKCKNPLMYEDKYKYVEDAFSDIDVNVVHSSAKTIFDILRECYESHYDEVYIFGGDDRQADFDRLKKYNGDTSLPKEKYYEFKKIEVLSAGARNENSDDIEEQASASLLRRCVLELDYDKFEKFAGTRTLTEEMFEDLCIELGVEI